MELENVDDISVVNTIADVSLIEDESRRGSNIKLKKGCNDTKNSSCKC